MRDEILALNEKLTVKLQGDIVKAVTEVAKGVGLDLVLDKQVIIIVELILPKWLLTSLISNLLPLILIDEKDSQRVE